MLHRPLPRALAHHVREHDGGELALLSVALMPVAQHVLKCGADILSAGLGGILPPATRGRDAP